MLVNFHIVPANQRSIENKDIYMKIFNLFPGTFLLVTETSSIFYFIFREHEKCECILFITLELISAITTYVLIKLIGWKTHSSFAPEISVL